MKKLSAILILSIIGLSNAFGQNKITESTLIGTWKMTIEMDKVTEELAKEAKKSETLLEEVLLKSVSGLVSGIMDNVDIYIQFKRGGDAIIRVKAFEDDSTDEDTSWAIKNNRLYIEDRKGGNIEWDSDDNWFMQDGVLILDDKDKDDNDVKVYMVKVN